MPYGNHIAYTSKAVKVSLFDLSQQLLPVVTFGYGERGRGGGGERERRAKFGLAFLRPPLPLIPSVRPYLSIYGRKDGFFFLLTLSLFAQIHEGAVWGRTTLPLAQRRLKMASVEVMPPNPHPTGTGGSRPHSPDGPICIGSLIGPPASPRPPRLGSGYKISPPSSLPERRGAQPSPNPPPSPPLGSVCPC